MNENSSEIWIIVALGHGWSCKVSMKFWHSDVL